MKRYCKNVNIKDRDLVSMAVRDCLKGRYERRDVVKLFSEISRLSISEVKKLVKEKNFEKIDIILNKLVDVIVQELENKDIKFPDIWYIDKIDESSGKIRHIGIQNAKQQIYDYIAVYALKPVLVRIGEYQCASIKGRGQIYGMKAVQKWLKNDRIKYAAKLDIKKCYESIPQDKLMAFLRLHVNNEELLWLIEELLKTFGAGLSIGSYLSQYLCNLYLSELYHYCAEKMYRIRRSRERSTRVKLVYHTLFYMDDILLLGTNSKDMHRAVKLIGSKCNEMGLCPKSNWKVFNLNNNFIDIMGFRLYRDKVTIRRRIFKRLRRTYIRIWRRIIHNKPTPLPLCKRCLSYYGFLSNTNSEKFMTKYHVSKINRYCRRRVSNESKI